ncbi:unnamed protein product [Fraxinus pennsylvanica]|uniref:Uncharacterized protein n=1 Tax=Fraxinus pennsylvanica TaxID=56036 RepID=A0AAD1YWE4_9LAMI|nr:unnamed protein product [Fraxinus pennsylvanica]
MLARTQVKAEAENYVTLLTPHMIVFQFEDGVARYLGTFSPAMSTMFSGSILVEVPVDSSASFGTREGSFCRVHARMTNAKEMRANITAIPPNRYGIGDFHVGSVCY